MKIAIFIRVFAYAYPLLYGNKQKILFSCIKNEKFRTNSIDLQLKIQKTVPNVPHEPEKIYDATAEHLLRMWVYLGIFVIIETIIAYFSIRNISKDTQGK